MNRTSPWTSEKTLGLRGPLFRATSSPAPSLDQSVTLMKLTGNSPSSRTSASLRSRSMQMKSLETVTSHSVCSNQTHTPRQEVCKAISSLVTLTMVISMARLSQLFTVEEERCKPITFRLSLQLNRRTASTSMIRMQTSTINEGRIWQWRLPRESFMIKSILPFVMKTKCSLRCQTRSSRLSALWKAPMDTTTGSRSRSSVTNTLSHWSWTEARWCARSRLFPTSSSSSSKTKMKRNQLFSKLVKSELKLSSEVMTEKLRAMGVK